MYKFPQLKTVVSLGKRASCAYHCHNKQLSLSSLANSFINREQGEKISNLIS